MIENQDFEFPEFTSLTYDIKIKSIETDLTPKQENEYAHVFEALSLVSRKRYKSASMQSSPANKRQKKSKESVSPLLSP